MILQYRLNILENFVIILSDFEKYSVWVVFLERPQKVALLVYFFKRQG